MHFEINQINRTEKKGWRNVNNWNEILQGEVCDCNGSGGKQKKNNNHAHKFISALLDVELICSESGTKKSKLTKFNWIKKDAEYKKGKTQKKVFSANNKSNLKL